jgi:hypothetical protein
MIYIPDRNAPLAWRKKLILSLLSALGVIVVAACCTAGSRQSPSSLHSAPASGGGSNRLEHWKIEVGSDPAHGGGQRFSGSYAPGKILMVPAGAILKVGAVPANAPGTFADELPRNEWLAAGGELNQPLALTALASAGGDWRQECRAPRSPGLYKLVWQNGSESAAPLTLNVLVLTAADFQLSHGRTLVKVNGKLIGYYSDPAQATVKRVRESAAQYEPPRYFATLSPEALKLKFGENFELGQLVAFKDYYNNEGKKIYTTERHTDLLPPRLDLIEKLVKLRERLRSKGVKVTRFWITSGFRTPEYNRGIGGASYSRHCYGDAVDLCIDEDGDHHMDDLNGDGRIDRKDGIVIANAARELELEGAVAPGGIGVYEWDGEESVRSHVHIDCRGYISRWGQDGIGKNKKTFIWWPKAEFQDEDGE